MPSLGRVLERLTVAVDADTSEVDRKLHGLSDESKGGSWVGKLGGASSKAGAMMAVGIGGGIAAMAGFGLAAASQAEQSKIAFTSIMGDAGKAEAFLGELSGFAARTPFELPGLKDAASRLLAVGTESSRVIPIMTALGDSTSAMGTGAEGINRAVTALTQMQTKGKVTGEEMLQLAEAGVPAWDALATVMGVSVADAQKKVSAGQVEANTLFTALETKAGPAMQRVAGMMDKQSASAAGMLSTLKDTATQGLGQMMGPALQEIKRMMPEITTLMTSTFKDIGPQIAGLVPPILNLFKSLMGLVPGIVTGLGQVIPIVSKVLNVFADLMAKIPPGVILGIVAAFVAFGPAVSIISGVAAAVGFLISPVGLIVVAIAALAAGLIYAYKHFEGFRNVVDTVARFIGDNLKPILIGLGAVLLTVLSPVAAVAAAAYLLWKNWEQLPQLFENAINWIAAKFTEFAPKVLDALVEWVPKIVAWWYGTALPALIGFVVEGIKNLAGIWWDLAGFVVDMLREFVPRLAAWWYGTVLPWFLQTIAQGLLALGGLFLRLPGLAVNALIDLAPQLVRVSMEATAAMAQAVGAGLEATVRFLASLPGRAVSALIDLAPALYRAASSASQQLMTGLQSGVSAAIGVLQRLPGQIAGAVGDLGGILFRAGSSIIRGLINGIQNEIGNLQRMLSNVTDLIPSWKGPLDTDRNLLVGNGAAIMGGLIRGIEGQTGALRNTLGGITASISPTVAAAPSLAGSSGGFGGGGGPVVVNNVMQLSDGSVVSMNEIGKSIRVLFVDDGGRNAFAAAAG